MPSIFRTFAAALLASAAMFSCTACSDIADMQFTQDNRLTIVEPENLATVELPLTIRWTMAESAAAEPGQQFAVFLNSYPMAPGGDLESVVASYQGCANNARCLEPDFLASRFGIYLTSGTEVTVQALPTTEASGSTSTDGSYFTIVLLDADGKRVGESVWYQSFTIGTP